MKKLTEQMISYEAPSVEIIELGELITCDGVLDVGSDNGITKDSKNIDFSLS